MLHGTADRTGLSPLSLIPTRCVCVCVRGFARPRFNSHLGQANAVAFVEAGGVLRNCVDHSGNVVKDSLITAEEMRPVFGK